MGFLGEGSTPRRGREWPVGSLSHLGGEIRGIGTRIALDWRVVVGSRERWQELSNLVKSSP